MRVQLPSAEGEKLCHARPGQVVRFGAESGDSATKFPGVYIVCLTEQPAKQKPQDGLGSVGLYKVGHYVRLLDVNTEVTLAPPSLSVRCEIYRKSVLQLYVPAEVRDESLD